MKDVKSSARAAAAAARAEAFARGQGQAAELLADFLAAHRGKVLSGYMPFRTEIDPLPAMAAHQGPVGLPVIPGRDQPLQFREWSPGAPLIEGAFKALIPAEGAWLEPEILIVPMLAFDARGCRLGYGGGFYDRTLEMLRARRPTLAVGFAFDAQEVAEVPIEDTDQRLDVMVTESGVRVFG
ncbi:5-formyltetrahydrofolate cyclo-ligase [Xinfangfangia sp. D13-10-4-6]|uniref:5-formyltetrahydrofolate cyclo-ligase n=1 Tax=Pseudogemmobacter hezensis TaxID=2737662 RepID=UPI0015547379|nr:5-formyltetrahydrofolate cyclo-ligase [Pseudogemmobacter hezensis]NPD15275.1 5-formyltetrahydrofolate cyclo-ligase [Pseudogemmobacter hezensis]